MRFARRFAEGGGRFLGVAGVLALAVAPPTLGAQCSLADFDYNGAWWPQFEQPAPG